MLIHKLPFQKRRYNELGIDINESINKAFYDKEYGLSVTAAGGALMGTVFLFLMALAILISKKFDSSLSLWHFIILIVISAVVCYLFVFKDDKYLRYFKRFDAWTKVERKRYYSYSFILVAIVLGLLVLSFW